ncbi:MAG: Gfo/Idh/MocA family oxidoreductase [Dysgonamonadaceae bacterium]|nr:Gfo/Idh/MocA family oxidoreductase [Dysgonamonadaceae bacterium]MDD4728275.1 Gfo/Idh/MocA family oxidoreductase [Dysgonamonadaceae bacterium]
MQINRRNFLRIAGATGIGAMLPNISKSAEFFFDKDQHSPKALKNIYRQAYKKHPQKFNMCGYAAPKLDTVRIAIVGLGSRGGGAVQRLSYIDGVKIVAICDELESQAIKAKSRIKTPEHPAVIYAGKEDSWKEMCRREDIDLVYVTTPWELHAPIGVYAMKQGKHVALEIPAAKTIEECWELVQTSEKTKKHCVILENCCYDFFELLTLNLARNGFFGEIIHTEGAYIHTIGKSLFFRGKPGRSWRLKENMERNGNLYPTHGLGPVGQIMNLNRGNQMDYMVSMSSNDFMMNEFAKELSKEEDYFKQFIDAPYRGNMNSSIIRTVKGQTILIQHDVTTPRPYSRLHTISGTKATAQKYPLIPRIAIGEGEWLDEKEMKELEEKYNPPLIKKMQDIAKEIGGHGGMDFLMDWRLIDCLRNGLPVDMDVYDAAAWSVIGPLSEWSVANRSAPIDIPDFTNGSWKKNIPHDISLQHGGNTRVREDIEK